jgi:RimJ/RimL family protein N-acetyltransferase
MITGQHSCIRTSEPDDVAVLHCLYVRPLASASLMDRRREPIQPTRDELRELIRRDDAHAPSLYTVEDRKGEIKGFCMFRTGNQDLASAQAVVLFLDDGEYESPMADEVFDHFAREAFVRKRLNKMVAHCAAYEEALRRFLLRKDFVSDGVQRDVFFGGGRYHGIESLSLFRRDFMGEEL